MPFDAGAIIGSLQLDTSGYTGGMLEAEGLAKLFPAVVTDFMVNPLLGFAAIAKETADSVARAVEFVVHDVEHIGTAFHTIGLEAERAGFSVEAFSKLSLISSTVGVSAESFGNALKFLQEHTADAANGNKEAAEHFQALGISVDFLRANLNDSQAVLSAVKEGIDGLGSNAEKTRAAMSLMGREGASLVPLFSLSAEATAKLGKEFEQLGAVVTRTDVEMGQKFGAMEALVSAAWTGIEQTLARPVLGYISEHFDDISSAIVEVAGDIRDTFVQMGPEIKELTGQLFEFGEAAAKALGEELRKNTPELKELLRDAIEWGQQAGPGMIATIKEMGTAFHEFADVLVLVEAQLKPVLKLLEEGERAYDWLKGKGGGANVSFTSGIIPGVGIFDAVDKFQASAPAGIRDTIDAATSGSSEGLFAGFAKYVRSVHPDPAYHQVAPGAQPAASPAQSAPNVTMNLTVPPLDPHLASSAMAVKLQPAIRDAAAKQAATLNAAADAARTGRAL